MGLIKRVKEIPKGARDALTEGIDNGVPDAILSGIAKFGEKNADARKTIGEDILR